MPGDPEDRGEQSRRAIIEAALPVFARDGYAAASLNQIIEASGLTKGGFYFHFRSKLDLGLEVFRYWQSTWMQTAAAEVSRYPRAVDRLFAYPRVLASMFSRGEGPAVLGRLVNELARDPDLRDEVCGSIRASVDIVADQFRAAQAEGDIRPDLDPYDLAEVAVGGFLGMQALSEQLGDDHFERRLEALIRTVQQAALIAPSDSQPTL
jgi:AcrR family transcriptional regulator